MPRVKKTEEMKRWVSNKKMYAFKLLYSWNFSNKVIGVISESKEIAEKIMKDKYTEAEEIIFIGSIDSLEISS